MVGRTEAFKTDFARSLRPASMARCTGSSGGFASYRRDPLLGTYREGGAVLCRPGGFDVSAGAHAAQQHARPRPSRHTRELQYLDESATAVSRNNVQAQLVE